MWMLTLQLNYGLNQHNISVVADVSPVRRASLLHRQLLEVLQLEVLLAGGAALQVST
jgi:hypothetical protein